MRLGRPERLALACAALVGGAAGVWGLGACGGRADPPAAARREDAAVPADAAAPVELAPRPLGLPELAAFQWRRRGGHAAFRLARKAEAVAEWEAVVAACRQALAADPGHLEASWLLAAALGRLGRTGELVEPLRAAVAGDFGKWGRASLVNPAFAGFLATPTGQAWGRLVEADRAAYVAALARAVVVTAGGELYAYDARGPRWYRLTQTGGAVIGGLRVAAPPRIVYVARQRARGKREATLAVGVVDLEAGRTLGAVELGTRGPIAVAYGAKQHPGVWIGTRGGRPAGGRGTAWQLLDESGRLGPLPARAARPPGPWLDVAGPAVRTRAIPVPGVTADFDDAGLASAIRIGRSNRIVSVPPPALIEGHSLRWSPDRARLAFVAQLDAECADAAGPGSGAGAGSGGAGLGSGAGGGAGAGAAAPVTAAAYVADATTGALRELERAAGGLAVDWLADGRAVVAGDGGVSILDVADAGAAPVLLAGADGLLAARLRPKCTPPDDADAPAPAPEDPDPAEVAPAAPAPAPAPAAAPAAPGAGPGSSASAAPPPVTGRAAASAGSAAPSR